MATNKTSDQKAPNFEEALTSLENIVNEIESNPLELEELVSRYEKGMKLLNQCRTILEDTKKRLAVLDRKAVNNSSRENIPDTNQDDSSDFRLS